MKHSDNVLVYLKSNAFVSIIMILLVGTLTRLTPESFLVIFGDLILISLINSSLSIYLKLVVVFFSNPLLSLLVLHKKFFTKKTYYEEMIDFKIYDMFNVMNYLIDHFANNLMYLFIFYLIFIFICKCMRIAGLKFVIVYDYDFSSIAKHFRKRGLR